MFDHLDTSSCSVCGMPLAYDRLVVSQRGEEPPSDSALCSHCADPKKRGRFARSNKDNAWVLDLILDIYRQGGGFRRAVAKLLSKTSLTPIKLRMLCELINVLPYKSSTNESEYEAIALYSGGKDSSYMLVDLTKRGIRVCAWMLNQGYQSPTAIDNAKRLCEKLGVPLVIEQPEKPKMDKLFRLGFSITDQDTPQMVRSVMTYGSACWPCFATIAARATTFCAERSIPFCFIGTQAGQNRLDLDGQPGLEGIVPKPEHLLERFVGPISARAAEQIPESSEILKRRVCGTVLLPYYEFVRKPEVDEQIDFLTKAGWKMPNNTGACSTNCMINELGRQVMHKRFGFDIYQIIDAHERRLGNKVARSGADLRPPEIDQQAVRLGAKMINLTDEEAREYGLEVKD